VQAEIMDMMIRIDIDGVFTGTQASGVARENIRDVEEGEEVLAIEVEQVDAIVDIEALKKMEKLLQSLTKFFAKPQNCTTKHFTHIVPI